MRINTCKPVRGNKKIQLCRGADGRVLFRRKRGGGRMSGASPRRKRKCTRWGRSKGRRVCRRYGKA